MEAEDSFVDSEGLQVARELQVKFIYNFHEIRF